MSAPEVASTGPTTVTRVGNVSGVKTDLAITQFSDKLLLHLTQLGKFGSWLQVERQTVRKGDFVDNAAKHVYACTVLLGQDTEELHFFARTLAEKLNITKPLVISVGVKNLTVPLALELVKFVCDNIQ